ncbi:MAG: Crp/Fnr family transcriptional regulator [Bacteroidia bacterium]|nr:Crp/Fnr family transcriptional regulator [Bacteroidia bacterium]
MEDHSLLFESIKKHVAISDEQLKAFVSLATERKYKKGQFLLTEGSTIRKTHFIKKGALIAYYVDLQGMEHVVQFGIEGWWISDIQSYVKGDVAKLNVQALEDSSIYEFSNEVMEKAYDEIPPITRYFLKITQNAFATFQARVLADLSESAEKRYKLFREKYPKIELRFPQKMIASYIGVTPESLSRLKKGLINK